MMFREIHEIKEGERNLNKDNYKKIKPENYGSTKNLLDQLLNTHESFMTEITEYERLLKSAIDKYHKWSEKAETLKMIEEDSDVE